MSIMTTVEAADAEAVVDIKRCRRKETCITTVF